MKIKYNSYFLETRLSRAVFTLLMHGNLSDNIGPLWPHLLEM